ncbi:MAG: hypothetical protein HQ478_13065 [Chloroflexi bacterium]|nr:hypothetical protein [Chloroflexota bacterium]
MPHRTIAGICVAGDEVFTTRGTGPLGLWLLATVEGVDGARRLWRLCEEHDPYRRMRGGVPLNYHMFSDFRVALDGLLTEILAALMAQNLVKLTRVSQDGMRVRASTGSGSYRRRGGQLRVGLDRVGSYRRWPHNFAPLSRNGDAAGV